MADSCNHAPSLTATIELQDDNNLTISVPSKLRTRLRQYSRVDSRTKYKQKLFYLPTYIPSNTRHISQKEYSRTHSMDQRHRTRLFSSHRLPTRLSRERERTARGQQNHHPPFRTPLRHPPSRAPPRFVVPCLSRLLPPPPAVGRCLPRMPAQ